MKSYDALRAQLAAAEVIGQAAEFQSTQETPHIDAGRVISHIRRCLTEYDARPAAELHESLLPEVHDGLALPKLSDEAIVECDYHLRWFLNSWADISGPLQLGCATATQTLYAKATQHGPVAVYRTEVDLGDGDYSVTYSMRSASRRTN